MAKVMKMKVRHTLIADGKKTVELSPVTYVTPAACRIYIESKLAETYGEDMWRELHGDDLTVDAMGLPFYEFDIGDGDSEKYEVITVDEPEKPVETVKVELELTREEYEALKEEAECRLKDWEITAGDDGDSDTAKFRTALFRKVVGFFNK